MTRLKEIGARLLIATILICSCLHFAGCVGTSKIPYQEGVDIVWLEYGEVFTAPVRGVFFSDTLAKEECGA